MSRKRMNRGDSLEAPRRFKTAFIFFSSERHKEIKEELAEKGMKEKTTNIAKMVSKEWKEMSPEEKEFWEEKSKDDRHRYDLEMIEYNEAIKRSRIIKKDPTAPKRPMSAFLAFSNKRRAALKKENPQMTNADLSKELSKAWKEAGPDLKNEYIQEEARLRADYKLEHARWKKLKAEESKPEYQLSRSLELLKQSYEATNLAGVNLGLSGVTAAPSAQGAKAGGTTVGIDPAVLQQTLNYNLRDTKQQQALQLPPTNQFDLGFPRDSQQQHHSFIQAGHQQHHMASSLSQLPPASASTNSQQLLTGQSIPPITGTAGRTTGASLPGDGLANFAPLLAPRPLRKPPPPPQQIQTGTARKKPPPPAVPAAQVQNQLLQPVQQPQPLHNPNQLMFGNMTLANAVAGLQQRQQFVPAASPLVDASSVVGGGVAGWGDSTYQQNLLRGLASLPDSATNGQYQASHRSSLSLASFTSEDDHDEDEGQMGKTT